MMVQYGPYALMALIALMAIGLMVFIGFMVRDSMQEKKAKEEAKNRPRVDTLADQIKTQFEVADEAKDRYIYTKLGVSKTKMKPPRSVFSFREEDAEKEISLESKFDNGPETPFIPPEEKI